MNIHKILQQEKYRAFILFPPLLICICGYILVSYTIYNPIFCISDFIRYTYIISTLILILNTSIITWSDLKKKINYD